MRPGALIPALALGAALLAPPVTEAAPQRGPERGRSGNQRSVRSQGPSVRGHTERSYRRGRFRASTRRAAPAYSRDRSRAAYRHRRPRYRPRSPRYDRRYDRPYYRPYYRPYPRPYYRPYPRPLPYGVYAPYPRSYAPGPPLYGPWPRYRSGVHGHVAIGLPFLGFSLFF